MITATYKIGKKNVTIATEQNVFDTALVVLNKAGYAQTTTQQLAQARIALGSKHDVSQNGSYVQEGFLYMPKELDNILVVDGKHNPILKKPSEATNAHRNGKEFYVEADKLRQLATADGKKNGVLLLPRSTIKNISVDALADHPLSNFSLNDSAKAYGKFLKDYGIKEVPILTVDKDYTQKQDKPFARLLWLRSLNYDSDFYVYDRLLYFGYYLVRGVRGAPKTRKLSKQLVE